jgi:5'-nucleotidase
VKPYVIFEDYQLGVIGFITNGTAGLTPGAANIRFYNPVVPVQRYVDELHSLGIKRIICVSHNGYNDDKYLAEK